MISLELSKHGLDLDKRMIEMDNFKVLSKQLDQEEIFKGQQTIVIDIENTMVTKIDIKSQIELEQLRNKDNFIKDYIIIKTQRQSSRDGGYLQCCKYVNSSNCVCNVMVF